MSDEINKQRLPTKGDLIILEWLQSGQSINNAEAISKFNNACLRDCVWRLGNAGYQVNREWVQYVNRNGQKKKYKSYFMVNPEILESGAKTENEAVAYRKDVKNASDYAKDMQESCKKPLVANPTLFY